MAPNQYFRGIYIDATANGFVLEEGGQQECLQGTRWCFNSREDLAKWILNDMKRCEFEKPKAVFLPGGGTISTT